MDSTGDIIVELNNNLMNIEELTYQDLEILSLHSNAGDTHSSSILKSWMNSLSYEDGTFGGVLGLEVLGHIGEPSLERSKLVTWSQSGEWVDSSGYAVSGITHFSELPEDFFKDTLNFVMPEPDAKLSISLKLKRFVLNVRSALPKLS